MYPGPGATVWVSMRTGGGGLVTTTWRAGPVVVTSCVVVVVVTVVGSPAQPINASETNINR